MDPKFLHRLIAARKLDPSMGRQGALGLVGRNAVDNINASLIRGPGGEHYVFPQDMGITAYSALSPMRKALQAGIIDPTNNASDLRDSAAHALADNVMKYGMPKDKLTPHLFDSIGMTLDDSGRRARAVAALAGPEATGVHDTGYLYDLISAPSARGSGSELLANILRGPLYPDAKQFLYTPLPDARDYYRTKFGGKWISPKDAESDKQLSELLRRLEMDENAQNFGVGLIKRAQGGLVNKMAGGGPISTLEQLARFDRYIKALKRLPQMQTGADAALGRMMKAQKMLAADEFAKNELGPDFTLNTPTFGEFPSRLKTLSDFEAQLGPTPNMLPKDRKALIKDLAERYYGKVMERPEDPLRMLYPTERAQVNSLLYDPSAGWIDAVKESVAPEFRDLNIQPIHPPATSYRDVRTRPEGTRRLVMFGTDPVTDEPKAVFKMPVRPQGYAENRGELEALMSGNYGDALPKLYQGTTFAGTTPLPPAANGEPADLLVTEYVPGGKQVSSTVAAFRRAMNNAETDQIRALFGLGNFTHPLASPSVERFLKRRGLGSVLDLPNPPQYWADLSQPSSWGQRNNKPVLLDVGAISPYTDDHVSEVLGVHDWLKWRDSMLEQYGVDQRTIFNEKNGGLIQGARHAQAS